MQPDVIAKAKNHVVKPPAGVKGKGAIAFGGGYVLGKNEEEVLRLTDPEQLVKLG